MKKILVISILFVVAGCGAQRPVLYPNEHLQQVGEAHAQNDINECYQMAEAYLTSDRGAKVAKDTAEAGAIGGAAGAAGGAVWGHAGKGAASGAAVGATGGLLRGIFRASEPSPVYKNFVNRCLQEKGYEPIGWE